MVQTDDEPGSHDPHRERTIRSDRRMSDTEALMWNVEKDPYLDPTFGSVTLLDRSPDMGRLRRRLLRMVEQVPRLHQRVAPALGRLAPPEWEDDADFDIDYHFRHIALPAPGSHRELFDFATHLIQDPLDRTRPLWEFVVVAGVEGDGAALVQKMHHTITDGEGGIRMSEQFIDVTRDVDDIAETAIVAEAPPTPTNLLDTTAETLAHIWRRTLGLSQRALATTGDGIIHPTRITRLPGEAAELVRSTLRQITVTDQARSPAWTQRSLRHRLEVLDLGFDDARRVAKSLGGSLNDVFVTGVAGGAGAYHRAVGAPVEELRVAMPVSTRHDDSAGGNSFVPTRVLIPVAIEDPVERFEAVSAALTRTKHEKVIGLIENLAGIANLLPTSVLARFTRDQARTIDFTTSNVRAAPFDLYIAGAHIEATYPLGPISNTAFNITMMSYRGMLNMGLHIDVGAVAQPELLRDCIREAFEELLAAGA